MNTIKIPYKFELYTGPFACGKTTSLINKYKEVRQVTKDVSKLKFFVMDSLCESMNRDTNINPKREITFLPFSSVFSLTSMDKDRTSKYFIDNVDVFISSEGLDLFDTLLENTSELYISSMSEKMTNAFIHANIGMEKAGQEAALSIIRYLKSIPNVEVHEMLMKDNPYLPKDYISQIKEIYEYEEL